MTTLFQPSTLTAFILIIAAIVVPVFSQHSQSIFRSTAFRSTACSLILRKRAFSHDSAAYKSSIASYFTAQEQQLRPTCVIRPKSSQEVARVIKALAFLNSFQKTRLPFAIRGGGHSPVTGSANIDNGVTIDLSAIKKVNVSADQTITSVGGGATWGDLYNVLDPMGLSVVGGHVYDVGVAGLTLGGGLSSFSPRFGFVCDNVENFEVVLASGQIVNANADENNDLWRALRGGSNNFGVVTRFDMRTFPQGKIWAGYIVYPISTLNTHLQALASMPDHFDPYASLKQSFTWMPQRGYSIAANIEYTNAKENPPVFEPFTDIEPQYRNTVSLKNMSEISLEIKNLQTAGSRQTFATTSFQQNLQFLHEAYDIWDAHVLVLKKFKVEGLRWTMTLQRLHPAIVAKSPDLGGNSIGLQATSEPLIICILSYAWTLASDDDLMERTGRSFINEIDEASTKAGLFNRYKYINYAASFQDPIGGYGPQNKASLRKVSIKYDRKRLFQKAVPGGFKLFA